MGALSPGDLALRLDRLHWGTTPDEAKQFYPALKLVPDVFNPGAASASFSYDYAGCSFGLTLFFFNDYLDRDISPARGAPNPAAMKSPAS
jgi:hypothetical protein